MHDLVAKGIWERVVTRRRSAGAGQKKCRQSDPGGK
jgi:hypothetical protein